MYAFVIVNFYTTSYADMEGRMVRENMATIVQTCDGVEHKAHDRNHREMEDNGSHTSISSIPCASSKRFLSRLFCADLKSSAYVTPSKR